MHSESGKENKLTWWDSIIPLVSFLGIQLIFGFVAVFYVIATSGGFSEALGTGSVNNFEELFFLNSGGILGWATIASFILTLGLLLIYIKFRNLGPGDTGLGRPSFRGFNLAAAITFALLGVSFAYDKLVSLLGFNSHIQVKNLLDMFGQNTQGLALMGITIVVLAPIVEEIVFRGFLFRFFDKKFGFWIGATVSAIVFATGHLILTLLPIFLLIGFVFAYLAKRFDSLWPAIFSHFIYNGVAFILLYLSIA